ncbi:MAG: TIGR00153 family protein [Myxococcota bacterium]
MRIPLARLFRKSPFKGIVELMGRVSLCTAEIPELIDLLIADEQGRVREQARYISQLEAAADTAKNEVRSAMPVRLFLPVDRRDVLKLVTQLDAIADSAEDVGVLLTLRRMTVPHSMSGLLREFTDQTVATTRTAGALVGTLEPMLGSAFAGRPAQDARLFIEEIARQEHDADKLQDQLAKELFALEDELSPVAISMWLRILEALGNIANHAENVGDQFRLFLAR